MKKLKLTALSIGVNDVLTREQLKNVLGGVGGTCCGHTVDGKVKQCGVSKAEAQGWPMWCCESC